MLLHLNFSHFTNFLSRPNWGPYCLFLKQEIQNFVSVNKVMCQVVILMMVLSFGIIVMSFKSLNCLFQQIFKIMHLTIAYYDESLLHWNFISVNMNDETVKSFVASLLQKINLKMVSLCFLFKFGSSSFHYYCYFVDDFITYSCWNVNSAVFTIVINYLSSSIVGSLITIDDE